MICPLTDSQDHHCHVEGCRWPEGPDATETAATNCGLARLGYTYTLSALWEARGTPQWTCGAARNLMSDPNSLRVLIGGPVPRKARNR